MMGKTRYSCRDELTVKALTPRPPGNDAITFYQECQAFPGSEQCTEEKIEEKILDFGLVPDQDYESNKEEW